jgi:hypothetical protein
MPTKEFIHARSKGEIAQDYVAGMFRSWGLTVRETPRGYHPGFDMEVEGQFYGNHVRFKDEIKYDRKFSETGNFCLDINSIRKSKAGILTICTGKPIDTVYMLPLPDALAFAERWPRKLYVGEYKEPNAIIPKDVFIESLKPKILTTNTNV